MYQLITHSEKDFQGAQCFKMRCNKAPIVSLYQFSKKSFFLFGCVVLGFEFIREKFVDQLFQM